MGCNYGNIVSNLGKVSFYLEARRICETAWGSSEMCFACSNHIQANFCVLIFSSINVELCLFNYLLFRVTHACSIFMYTNFSLVRVFSPCCVGHIEPELDFAFYRLLFRNLHINFNSVARLRVLDEVNYGIECSYFMNFKNSRFSIKSCTGANYL